MMKEFMVISVFLFCQIINSQNNNVVFRINNNSISNCKTTLLEIEVINNSKDTLYVPFDTKNFSSYEFSENEILISFSENIEIEGIVPSVRIFDSINNKLLNHLPNYPFKEITLFDQIKMEQINLNFRNTQKIYKKFGINKSLNYIKNLDYLLNNLHRLEPNSSIVFYIPLNLKYFETFYFNQNSPLIDGFNITDSKYKFKLKLIYNEVFLKSYYDIIKEKFINNNPIVNGIYESNSILISIDNCISD